MALYTVPISCELWLQAPVPRLKANYLCCISLTHVITEGFTIGCHYRWPLGLTRAGVLQSIGDLPQVYWVGKANGVDHKSGERLPGTVKCDIYNGRVPRDTLGLGHGRAPQGGSCDGREGISAEIITGKNKVAQEDASGIIDPDGSCPCA